MRLLRRVVLAILLAAAGLGPALDAQSLSTVSGNRGLSSRKDLHVNVKFAAGTLAIGRDETGMLYRATVSYDEDRFEPVLEYTAGDATLRVGVNGLKGTRDHGDHSKGQRMRLDISPKVATSFNIDFGAAEADVNLGGLNLVRAEMNIGATDAVVRFNTPTTGRCDELKFHVGAAKFRGEKLGNSRCRNVSLMGGVGDLTVDLTGDWGEVTRPNADITVGMGSVTLVLPRDIGVQVEVSKVFATFEQAGLIKRDGAYYSANYDTASTKLHIGVNTALGSVNVEWR